MSAAIADTRLETLLHRDRLLVATGLMLAVLLSWSWLVPMARDMYGDMLGAAILLAAGVYQLTPFKRSCLAHCRSPAAYIAEHWRGGMSGALRMGMQHGAYCLGCCWALMLLLFFGGVMSLAWIALLAIAVLIEKVLPIGPAAGRVGGLLLIAAGIAVWLRG